MLVRKARLQDASNVHDLVNSLSGDGTLLKRPFAEICENIRDFTVAESRTMPVNGTDHRAVLAVLRLRERGGPGRGGGR